ncbi:hypothetical protein NTJ12_002509 [Flavobacterium psychrophilum]|nr:hypothetical protein [Flavobacterium psychrophilum]
MEKELIKIIELENNRKFELAFKEYVELYSRNKNDFEVWKNFFFFLWVIIEEMPNEFSEKIEREKKLKEMFEEGLAIFSQNPEFNFITGYVMSIFPYEFGDFIEYERKSSELLAEARNLEPDNDIYEMVYLGNSENSNSEEYLNAKNNAKPKVIEKYKGSGLLNEYFKQVLIRKE